MAEPFTGSITAGYRRTLRMEGERGSIELELRVTVPAGTPDSEVDAAVRSAQRALDALRSSIDTRISEAALTALPVIGTHPSLPPAVTNAPSSRSMLKPIPADTAASDEDEDLAGAETTIQPSPEAQPIPLNQIEDEEESAPAQIDAGNTDTQPEPAAPAPTRIGRGVQRLPVDRNNGEESPAQPVPPRRPTNASVNEPPATYESTPVAEPNGASEPAESNTPSRPAAPVRPMTATTSRWNFGSKRDEPEEPEADEDGAKEQEQSRKQPVPVPPPASELQEAVANVVSLPRRTGTPPPRTTKPADGQNPRVDLPATPQQLQSIRSMATEELRLSDVQFETKIRELTGRNLETITRNQAFSVIVDLRREINQRNSGEEMTELERARAVVAPIGPFKGKTLGEIETEKPGAVNYFINARGVSQEVQEAARIIVNNRNPNQQ